MTRWPHQLTAVQKFKESVLRGCRRILLTAPPGAGKTTMALDIVTDYLNRGEKAVFYSNRRSLIMQTSRAMLKGNLDHGIRMAGCEDERHLPFQIASIQTEASRVLKKGRIELHDAKIVVLDEPHLNTGKDARTIMDRHVEAGATIFAPTATPIDLDGLYDDLIVAGTPSELRACGAIVPCIHYGPDEPDLRDLGKLITGKDLTEKQATKAIMRQGIYGRVLGSFFAINPTKRPTLLFAPGVQESFWFAAEFAKKGIKAAHIDGDRIWISGEGDGMDSTDENRMMLFNRHRIGEITVICNRFVMREGIDLPWASHLIFATIFGSLASYIQSGGRGGRAYPGKTHYTVQDHGGCLDSSTEVLTSRGWVGCDGIQDDDTVAAYDRFSGSIRWCPILHRHDRILDPGEKMYEAQGRCLNIRVTGNHRILTTERESVGDGKIWRDSYEFMRADELSPSSKRVKIPVAGVQRMPGVRLSDDQLRFLGWWITDGTRSGKREQVSITQADHQPQIAALRACLVACGFNFREVKRKPSDFSGSKAQTEFQIPKGTCKSRPRKGWWELRHYMDKDLALPLELMDERQFGVFLEAVHLGDGDKAKGDGAYRISTGNKTFADRLQSIAVRRGWKCNIGTAEGSTRLRPIYILNMQNQTSSTLHGREAKTADQQLKLVESTSIPGVTRVWCVANELETLITRRNGMVAIIGNSWWRHGSLNEDREWFLDCTSTMMTGARKSKLQRKLVKEPSRCPKCAMILAGMACRCGFVITAKSRPVVQSDGTLIEHRGDIFRAPPVVNKPDTFTKWKRMYYRARNSQMTFAQAEALFFRENFYYPPQTLPRMPKDEYDRFRKVRDVSEEGLI